MKNFLARVSGAWLASQFLVQRALALNDPTPINGISNETGTDGITNAIVKVVETVLDFILLIAVVYVIVAGIRLIVSGGDEGQKDSAKKTIIYVIVGIIIILLARVIVSFVAGVLDA
jgi:succinate dehydrogenase/fumarate reductase cytochrome b subunit